MQDYEQLINWLVGGGAFGAVFKIIELRGKGKVDAISGFKDLVTALQEERKHLLNDKEDIRIELEKIKAERNELQEWQKIINEMMQKNKKLHDEGRKH